MPAATRSGLTSARIELARVLDVDTARYTLVVSTEFTKPPQTDVSFATPYQHHAGGEGIYFMPEVGSMCWLCFPSDGNRPFVMGWTAPSSDENDYSVNKMALNPGDIYLGTRDDNFLVLRRGGVVQIGAGPLAQRIFLPVNNTIKDFCENYGLHSIGGDLEWVVDRSEATTDGRRPTKFRVLAREYANDRGPIAALEIGSHGEGDPTILSLRVKGTGSPGSAEKFSLLIDKNGNVKWIVEKDVSWSVSGKFEVDSDEAQSFRSLRSILFDAPEVTIKGSAVVKVEAPSIALAGNVSMGGAGGGSFDMGEGSTPVLVASPSLLAWLAGHVHKVVAVGVETSPPIGLVEGHVSTKMKAK